MCSGISLLFWFAFSGWYMMLNIFSYAYFPSVWCLFRWDVASGLLSILIFLFKKIFWLHRAPCGILVPQLGIEPGPSAVKVQSPNHWTAREFLVFCPFLNRVVHFLLLFLFIGVKLLYNVVLVSAVQWSESAIGIYISPPSWTSLPPRPPIPPF